jgi:pilus assembly protein CpaE
MHATASIIPLSKLEPSVDVLFYSSDEKRAQRLAARLRDLARVHWEDSRQFSLNAWRNQNEGRRLVLLDYTNDNAATSTELARQLLALMPGLPLFGVGSTAADHAAGVLAALRAGVLDFFDMDASDEEIRTLLEHAAHLPVDMRAATPPAPAPRRLGQLMLLLGVRPGVGCSTLAAHLGALAAPLPPKTATGNTPLGTDKTAPTDAPAPQALLLDLGQPAGDVELYLGVAGEFHYADALRNAGRIDATLLRSALSRHDASQLAVLSQGTQATLLPETADTGVLIERLREHVDLLLCDLGGLPPRQVPVSLLRAADEIWLVTTQGIAALVSLDHCLAELQQAGVRDRRLGLVVNCHDDDCGLASEQIAKRFELPLLATLPNRSRSLCASANQGKLLHQAAPRDPYIRALAPLRDRLHTANMPRETAAPWWKTLFKREGGSPWKTR